MPNLLSLEGDAGIHLNVFDQTTIIHPPLDPNLLMEQMKESTHIHMFRT